MECYRDKTQGLSWQKVGEKIRDKINQALTHVQATELLAFDELSSKLLLLLLKMKAF